MSMISLENHAQNPGASTRLCQSKISMAMVILCINRSVVNLKSGIVSKRRSGDRSTVARRLLDVGMKEWKLNGAVEMFRHSLGQRSFRIDQDRSVGAFCHRDWHVRG
jgi:hypothetical protein